MEIMSITKYNGKYMVYFPHINTNTFKDKICEWWGSYDDFDDCYDLVKGKCWDYDDFEIDNNLLRRLKLNKISKR